MSADSFRASLWNRLAWASWPSLTCAGLQAFFVRTRSCGSWLRSSSSTCLVRGALPSSWVRRGSRCSRWSSGALRLKILIRCYGRHLWQLFLSLIAQGQLRQQIGAGQATPTLFGFQDRFLTTRGQIQGENGTSQQLLDLDPLASSCLGIWFSKPGLQTQLILWSLSAAYWKHQSQWSSSLTQCSPASTPLLQKGYLLNNASSSWEGRGSLSRSALQCLPLLYQLHQGLVSQLPLRPSIYLSPYFF